MWVLFKFNRSFFISQSRISSSTRKSVTVLKKKIGLINLRDWVFLSVSIEAS